MKQYLDLLQNIIDNGVEKESGRANMPNTIGISKGEIVMDLKNRFPLLTTKKMYLKGIILELLWFLRGDTNIKYLIDNNVNIWNGDAYRWYQKHCEGVAMEPMSIDEFVESIKTRESIGSKPFSRYYDDNLLFRTLNIDYQIGDLGKVYGYQWRNQNGVDQIKEILDGLKTNPYSRYHILDGWNKADFKEMALPPCHLLYQFIVRPLSFEEKIQWVMQNCDIDLENLAITEEAFKETTPKFYLDLNMYQRSCDTFLGVPFNIASMSILLMLFAKTNNMVPGVATWIGGDTHLYVNHLPMVKDQINREPYNLPKLKINKELRGLEDILNLNYDDFELVDYKCHDAIKAELFTGFKPLKS